MNNPAIKLSVVSRVVLAIAAVGMLGAFIWPLWRFDFFAPQYPDGLWLYIWHDHFEGDIKVINGLNHYIGMKEINPESFPELSLIRYIIVGLAVTGILPVLTGRRWALYAWLFLLLAVSVVGLYDFWAWEYDYGHNLDPHAPIVNPGMVYQPPLIGYKRLMNFDIYSQPWYGGYSIILGVAAVMGITVLEGFRFRKIKRRQS